MKPIGIHQTLPAAGQECLWLRTDGQWLIGRGVMFDGQVLGAVVLMSDAGWSSDGMGTMLRLGQFTHWCALPDISRPEPATMNLSRAIGKAMAGAAVRPVCWAATNPGHWVEMRQHGAGQILVECGEMEEIPHALRLCHDEEFRGPWEVYPLAHPNSDAGPSPLMAAPRNVSLDADIHEATASRLCRSGQHEWFDAADRQRCCNGYERVQGLSRHDVVLAGADVETVRHTQTVGGVQFFAGWKKTADV